jgi:hypothetical protein
MATLITADVVEFLSGVIDSAEIEFNLWSKYKLLLGKNGWSEVEIPLAVIEIKRFLILKVGANDYNSMYLSPSRLVDEFWHLLLLFNKEYTDMCLQLSVPLVFDREMMCSHIIGHNPLGSDDLDLKRRYQRTLQMYEKVFGEPAPAIFWNDEANMGEKKAENEDGQEDELQSVDKNEAEQESKHVESKDESEDEEEDEYDTQESESEDEEEDEIEREHHRLMLQEVMKERNVEETSPSEIPLTTRVTDVTNIYIRNFQSERSGIVIRAFLNNVHNNIMVDPRISFQRLSKELVELLNIPSEQMYFCIQKEGNPNPNSCSNPNSNSNNY